MGMHENLVLLAIWMIPEDEVNRHASTGDLFPLYNTGVLMFLLVGVVVVHLWYT